MEPAKSLTVETFDDGVEDQQGLRNAIRTGDSTLHNHSDNRCRAGRDRSNIGRLGRIARWKGVHEKDVEVEKLYVDLVSLGVSMGYLVGKK